MSKKEKVDLDAMRHSCSHILAQAVMDMFPEAKLGIGPTIEDGFYYDFELPRTLIPEDLPLLEKKMKHIIKQNQKFVRKEEPGDMAVKFLKKTEQQYKVELAEEFIEAGEDISFYENIRPQDEKGMFVDLCEGPHVEHTGQIGPFKLMSIAGAYWRGSEKNPMLQRIYGTCWHKKEELDEHLKKLEEAKKRDHRRLGPQLDLFQFHDISPGSVFFLKKGAIVFNTLIEFLRREYVKRGYDEVITPLVYDKSLWETSGHWQHYKENMFHVDMDGREASLKPMNCPSHMLVYKMGMKSYRDLPVRIADFAMLHRNELRGALGGMTRVRKFCMDDAHLFVSDDQIEEEILGCIDFAKFIYSEVFDFEYEVFLSTKPEKAMGTDEQWKNAEEALEKALKKGKIDFKIKEGDGAFYGPKIDFHLKDSLAREWQCATVQIDFQMPQRFELEYEGADGKTHTPVVIHRALLGSLERFMAILLEEYAGAFPTWLAPVQAQVLPVSEKFNDYAEKIEQELLKADVRVDIDDSNETLGKKIRNAEMMRTPYMIVVGEKEVNEGTITVRDYATKEQKEMKVEDLLKLDNFGLPN
ncbi:threonine--tRNA ligase [Candidatus Peregrinibacteria bacterium]|jgi:threonyl-tRNA synthetase|nr:threonine--tRNA ligase [Candidatus Peregrinibacteria bacterium]